MKRKPKPKSSLKSTLLPDVEALLARNKLQGDWENEISLSGAFPLEVFSISAISPEEFERLVYTHLVAAGKSLEKFEVNHNYQLETFDGDYQIDIKAEIEILNVRITILVECKRHQSAIKREVVQLLHDKIRSAGAHKGIIFATTDFQAGAITFAKAHKIALFKVSLNTTGANVSHLTTNFRITPSSWNFQKITDDVPSNSVYKLGFFQTGGNIQHPKRSVEIKVISMPEGAGDLNEFLALK